MKLLSRAALASAALIILGGGAVSTALAAPSRASAPAMEPAMQGLQRSASMAQAHFARDAQARGALVAAVKSHNQAEARRLLAAAGFSAEDLSRSRLTLVDQTGAGGPRAAERIKVDITIRCCPPEIVIVIRF
jgi:hypothetical protein